MRFFIHCILSTALAGTLAGCNRREPAAAVAEPIAVESDVQGGDNEPAKFDIDSTSIEEVEPADAEAKLTVRVVIAGFGESDEVFFLKKVVTRMTFERN